MSPQVRKLIVAYFLLVGLPVSSVFGILKIGHRLRAPLLVDGNWIIEFDREYIDQFPCLSFLSNTSMLIEQSGRNVAFVLKGSTQANATGRIEGDLLQAHFQEIKDIPCKGNISLSEFKARVNVQAQPRTMAGTISVSGSPSGFSVRFTAARQLSPAKGSQ